jgi:TP901 family phage tail tape measure protein
MAVIGDIIIRVGARIDQLQKGLNQAERELQRSGRRMNRLGNDLTTSFTLPLAAIAIASGKAAIDFETSFTKINTLVGVSGETLENFKTGIASLSGPLGASKTALSDALFTITSAGQRGADALITLEQASKASAIGLGETKEIARAATAAVTAYGSANLSSADAIDKFTAIVREGNLEAAELAPQLGKILPIAAQLGVSFDEVGANIATFTRLGVNSAEAVTGVKSLLSAIIKPSQEASKELKRLGITSDDLRKSIAEDGLAATLQTLVKAYDGNVEGLSRLFPRVDALTNALGTAGAQGEEYIKIVKSIQNANGLVDEGFKTVANTAGFKLKQAFVNLENVGSQFGSVLIPIVTDLASAVVPLLEGFSKLDEGTKKLIVSTSLFVAAVGPALKVVGTAKIAYAAFLGQVGSLTKGIKKAAVAFDAFDKVTKKTTIGLVVVGLVAAAAAFTYLTRDTSAATAASERFKNAQAAIGQEAAKEQSELTKLIERVKSTTLATEERKKALNELKRIYPGYFSNINVEQNKLEDLDLIQQQLNTSILKGVAARKKADALNDIAGEIIEAELRLKQIENEGFGALTYLEQLRGGFGNLLNDDREAVAGEVVNSLRGDVERLKKEADETAKSFDNLFETGKKVARGGSRRGSNGRIPGAAAPVAALQLNDPTAAPSGSGSTTTQTIEVETVFTGNDVESKLSELSANLELIKTKNDVFGDSFDDTGARIGAFQTTINELLSGGLRATSPVITELVGKFGELNTPIQALDGALKNIDGKLIPFADSLGVVRDATAGMDAAFVKFNETLAIQQENVANTVSGVTTIQESIDRLNGSGTATGSVLAAAFAEMSAAADASSASFKEMGQAALEGARRAIKAIVTQGIVQVVGAALASAPFPYNLAIAPLAGIAAGVLFDGLTNGLIGLADGGVVSGRTLVEVGEYSGVSSNPEVIAPLSKLKEYINPQNGQGGPIELFGVLRGADIHLSNERTKVRVSRATG